MLQVSGTVALLSVQLLAGTVLCVAASWALRRADAPPRWRMRCNRGRSSLCRFVPVAVLGFTAAALLHWPQPVLLLAPDALIVAGGVAAAGLFLVAQAGRLEARGRFRPSRLQLRLGAGAQLVGTLAVITLFALRQKAAPETGRLVFALAGLLLAAAVGGLAALSRKPRPGGYIAVGLHALSSFLLVGALLGDP